MTELRSDLPPLPDRIRRLPVDARGYPVPWFVAWIDGKPDFRVADGKKAADAVNYHLCWICGRRLGTYLAFVIGPMCAVNRISSEPPSHRECAEFSARACPFLVRPRAKRREAAMPEEAARTGAPGIMLKRNPGVALVWITKNYRLKKAPNGTLFEVGEPREWMAFAEGRKATTEEIEQSVVTGLPALVEIAANDRPGAMAALREQVAAAARLLGITLPELPGAPPVEPARVFGRGPKGLVELAAVAALMGAQVPEQKR